MFQKVQFKKNIFLYYFLDFLIKKGDYLIKVFKGFLKKDYCVCPHYSSRNIVKNGSRDRKIKYIPIQNYTVELKENVSLTSIAKRYNISVASVQNYEYLLS